MKQHNAEQKMSKKNPISDNDEDEATTERKTREINARYDQLQ